MSRQKISLYIGGELADIPEQELVLYNYSVEDMKNPAAVKNSYSHTVTLPATQANNAIFGHYYRVDRKTVGSPASSTGAGISYYNNTARGYDMNGAAKLDFRGENGEAVEGADILCFFTGFANYSRFKISDDTAVMFSRAGKPCWSLDPGAGALSVPVFSGLVPSQGSTPAKLAYFGIPAVLDIPYLSPTDAANAQTFYARYWRAYMLDRYNRDTKVLQCRARLEGLQVGNELLRRLFWYEGSLWALNKISNFSLTSYNLADLELVQVHDVNSYTQGQIL